ncbi:hypothetical protein NUW58_g7669 [Xylaria curta]|uniref:Uncharacterized protein n=1 Tax=Xylaria curta TaxID=42375 RepID=A0ACC1NF34_9PEZI|nr:hypothetical protein NUW58_g7669 [Xylaria curta]
MIDEYILAGLATVVEIYVAIVGACLPTLMPVYYQLRYGSIPSGDVGAPPIELFSGERPRPFDVDFVVDSVDAKNLDNKSGSEPEDEGQLVEHEEVEALELCPATASSEA